MGSMKAFARALPVLAFGAAAHAADPADCAGFSAAKAAAFLGAPPGQVSRTVEKAGQALFLCSYAVGKAPAAIAFSLEAASSAKRAAQDLERYRENLVVAGETAPFKGRLPKGAYSDIMGVGDEGVWTDVNGALTVRKGSLTLQVTMPAGKLAQLKLAEAVLGKQ